MERPILSLFERRRRRLIIERQPYTPSTVFASFIDSPPRSRRGTSFVSKPLARTSRGGREPMKIQIPAFLISKRGLSASLRLHTGLRLWRQPCQQSRTNSNEETRPLFRPMLYRLAPPRFCLRFFLPLFRTSRPILFIATLPFFPLDAHLSEGAGGGGGREDNSTLSGPR